MAIVVNTIAIAGGLEPVFDLVTTARLWPQWHPATVAVGGVTERPFLLGDVIRERGQAAGLPFVLAWIVVEHARPQRIVIESHEPPARIAYTFRQHASAVEFTRELEYDPAVFRATVPDAAELQRGMHAQSQQALEQLKKLVEGILRKEQEAI